MSDELRILQVTTRYPPQTGGVEHHVAAISRRLAARGHDVTVLTADAGQGGERRAEDRGDGLADDGASDALAEGGDGDALADDGDGDALADDGDGDALADDGDGDALAEGGDGDALAEGGDGDALAEGEAGETAGNIDPVAVRRHRALTPGGNYHLAPGIYRAVRAADADVVHAHNYHSFPLALAAAGAGDSRFVATPHYHGESASRFRDLLHGLYRPVGRRALERADGVVAVSQWERDRLREDFGVDASVIPNGIDVERFEGAEPADRATPYLLTVGRLEAYKGVQHVVRALPDLDQDLVVAGSGPYRDRLARIAERVGVADRVHLPGFVPDEELPGLYAGADAYVAMSTHESFGLTVGEALAAGTPCVVRDGGALAEWGDRPDCVAVPADEVAIGVMQAVGWDAPAEPLPTWDKTVDSLEALYRTE